MQKKCLRKDTKEPAKAMESTERTIRPLYSLKFLSHHPTCAGWLSWLTFKCLSYHRKVTVFVDLNFCCYFLGMKVRPQLGLCFFAFLTLPDTNKRRCR